MGRRGGRGPSPALWEGVRGRGLGVVFFVKGVGCGREVGAKFFVKGRWEVGVGGGVFFKGV